MKTESIKSNRLIAFFVVWCSCMAFLCLCTAYIADWRWLLKAVLIATASLVLFRKKLSLDYLFTVEKEDIGYYVASMICLFPLAIFFEYRCCRVDILNAIEVKTGVTVKVMGMILTVVLALAAYPFLAYSIKYFFKDYLRINKKKLANYRFLIKPTVLLSVIFCLALLTILRSNYVYKDDMQRIVNGSTIYTREGRYLAEYVTQFLEMTGFFADISPITQILEMIIMAICSVLSWHWLTDKKKAGVFDIAAMMSFTLTPYFLEGVSFKWDSPQHACAVLFAVMPLFFCNAGLKKYVTVTALSMIALCSFHQVPMGLFPSLVIAKAFLDWTQKKKSGKEILVYTGESALGCLSGLLIYRLLLMKDIIRGENSTTSIFPVSRLIPGVIGNYKLFFENVFTDFEPLWLVLIAVLILGFFLITIMESEQGKMKAVLGTTLTFLCLTALCFGMYPLLENPLYYPRHLYSICFYVGILCIITVCVFDIRGIVTKSVSVVLAVCFFMFSIKYGNALYYQNQYVRFRTEMVVNKLAELDSIKYNDITYLKVEGDVGYCPEVVKMNSNMIYKLVPTSFGAYYASWYADSLYNQYGLRILLPDSDNTECTKDKLELVYENYYYSLYAKDNNVIVELKLRSDCLWP